MFRLSLLVTLALAVAVFVFFFDGDQWLRDQLNAIRLEAEVNENELRFHRMRFEIANYARDVGLNDVETGKILQEVSIDVRSHHGVLTEEDIVSFGRQEILEARKAHR